MVKPYRVIAWSAAWSLMALGAGWSPLAQAEPIPQQPLFPADGAPPNPTASQATPGEETAPEPLSPVGEGEAAPSATVSQETIVPTPVPGWDPPTVPLSATLSPPSGDYILGAGDLLRIEMFGAPEYSGEASVLPDGSVNLVRVGRVSVTGLTLKQAEDAIATRYATYLRRPLATLTLVNPRPFRIAVAGAVNRPGAYTVEIPEDADNRTVSPTVTDAISLAGGITPQANLREITVVRSRGQGLKQTFEVDLWNLLTGAELADNLALQGGDEIYIPVATTINLQEASTLGSASFAPDTIQVYVAGEVNSPGRIQVPPNTSLNQALLIAGSFNERANTSAVDLVRLNEDGTVTKRAIQVDLGQPMNEDTNPPLRREDVVVVYPTGLASTADTFNFFRGPISTILSLFGLINFFD